MTNFVQLAQEQNAHDFKEQLHAVLTEKVADALESKKSALAESLFVENVMSESHYVGLQGGKREVFTSKSKPTQETHGHLYSAIIGPFNTKKGAEVMSTHGHNNPHMQNVADAERFAKNNNG